MQVQVEEISKLERKLTITLPEEVVTQSFEQRLNKLSKEVSVKGFRPGKTPLSVVRQRYGRAIRDEVLSELMRSNLFDALTKEELNPVSQPFLEVVSDKPSEDFVFTATFEVLPDIEMTTLEGHTVTQKTAEILAEDKEKMLHNLREQHKEYTVVDRAAQNDDQVKIDFEGLLDGVAFEGGTAKDVDVVIGSNSMIPGFEEGLISHKQGDEFELNLQFPSEYHAENLAGKDVVFKIKVNKVLESKLPELDATFFHKVGISEGGLEELQTQIEKEMQRQLKQKLDSHNREQVLNKLLELNPIEVPLSLVDQEIDNMQKEAKERFKNMFGVDNIPDLPRDTLENQAKRRLQLGLLVSEYVKKHEITADKDKVRAFIDEIAATYEEPEHVVNWYYGNQQELSQVESAVIEQQVVEKLLADAKVKTEKASYNEMVNPEPEQKED